MDYKNAREVILEKEIEDYRKEINYLNEKLKESKQTIDKMRLEINSNIEELKIIKDNKIEINLTTSNRLGEVIKVANYIDFILKHIYDQRQQIIGNNYPRNSVGELLANKLLAFMKSGRIIINLIQIDDVEYNDYNEIPNYILINSIVKYFKYKDKTMIIVTEKDKNNKVGD